MAVEPSIPGVSFYLMVVVADVANHDDVSSVQCSTVPTLFESALQHTRQVTTLSIHLLKLSDYRSHGCKRDLSIFSNPSLDVWPFLQHFLDINQRPAISWILRNWHI